MARPPVEGRHHRRVHQGERQEEGKVRPIDHLRRSDVTSTSDLQRERDVVFGDGYVALFRCGTIEAREMCCSVQMCICETDFASIQLFWRHTVVTSEPGSLTTKR